jgi:hypothetical protein
LILPSIICRAFVSSAYGTSQSNALIYINQRDDVFVQSLGACVHVDRLH